MGPAFPISFRSHSTRSSCLHLNRRGWSCYAKKRMHPKDNTDLLEMKTSLILWHHYFRLPIVVGPKHCFSNRLLNPGDKEYCQPACTRKWKGFDPRYLSWFSFEYQRGFLSLSVLCDISLCQSMSLPTCIYSCPTGSPPSLATFVLSRGNGMCLFIYRRVQWIIATFTVLPKYLHNNALKTGRRGRLHWTRGCADSSVRTKHEWGHRSQEFVLACQNTWV